jgi:hypothetical protein
MTLVLLAVGLLVTAVGFVTIGFGIPINAFSLGNTLILTGAIAVATGLLLIAMAIAVGQLKRIAEALNARALSRGASVPESVEALVPQAGRMAPAPVVPPSPVPMRAPQPHNHEMPEPPLPDLRAHEPRTAEPLDMPEAPRPPEPPRMREMPRPPERRQPEPRFPVGGSNESRPGPLDWLRAKPKSAAPSPEPGLSDPFDPPSLESHDDLSSRPLQRPVSPFPVEPHAPAPHPSVAPPHAAPPAAEHPLSRPAPQHEPAKENEGFDLVWPDRAAPAPASEPAKAPSEMPLPPIPARPRESRPPERRPEAPPKPAERGPAILKSGVIDGMPYTLYANGSIEAELPQGTVKFASVDALRAHLEKQG